MTHFYPRLPLALAFDGLVKIRARLADVLQDRDLHLDAQAEVNTAIADINAAMEAIRRALGAVG